MCKIECSSYLIEYDMTDHYKGLLRNQQIGVGAADVQDPAISKAARPLLNASENRVGLRRSKPS